MRFAPTVSKASMPVLFHEPYVELGFRPLHQPWKSYMYSLFQWHNELMNIWTHLIALIVIVVRGGLWMTEFDIISDPYMWPMGVGLVAMVVLYACSAGAHCFHTKFALKILAAPLEPVKDRDKVKRYLLDTQFLQSTNSSTVSAAIVKCLVNNNIKFEDVVTVNTDNAAYMKKAYKLKGVTHVTCMAHIMNLLGEAFRKPFDATNKFVRAANAVFWNAGARKARFIRFMGQCVGKPKMPPNPVGTRSEVAHYVCFMIDYAGIGIYGFSSTMLHYWYSSHEDYFGSYIHSTGIPVGVVLGVFTCYCCSLSKVKYKRPYPYQRRMWQIGSVSAIYLWLSIPVWMKIGMYYYEGRWESSFGHHLTQTMWFVLGGFFFGSDIPQRLFPGKFDFVGHSHQLFHVCIMMTTNKQMDGVYLDVLKGIDDLRQTQAPTFIGTWGALFIVAGGSVAIVYNFYKSVISDLQEGLGTCKSCDGHEPWEGELRRLAKNCTSELLDAKSRVQNGELDQKLRQRNGWDSNSHNGHS